MIYILDQDQTIYGHPRSTAHRAGETSLPAEDKVTKKRPEKPYWEMNTQELADATAEFDEEFVIDKCTPLTPQMRARWEAAKRKLSRSKRNQDVRKISISVPKDLLVRADALAKKMGLSREGLIARGLKAVLAAEGEI